MKKQKKQTKKMMMKPKEMPKKKDTNMGSGYMAEMMDGWNKK